MSRDENHHLMWSMAPDPKKSLTAKGFHELLYSLMKLLYPPAFELLKMGVINIMAVIPKWGNPIFCEAP